LLPAARELAVMLGKVMLVKAATLLFGWGGCRAIEEG
jgi:hypothetical protein